MPTNIRNRYTYDQFRQAAESSGLLGEFSDADLSLAQRNPDAGMSLLNYKRDWHNATSDADREIANLGAEGIRRSYGSYNGGADGGNYYLEPLSPDMFEYGSAPEYSNRWDDTITGLIDDILNREDFAYDPSTDPLYSQYRKQYAREGNRATADALGAAAAASGGMPSSYAQTAAGQAGNYYAAQLTDKIPELWQLAYDKYLNDYNMMLSDLGVVQGQEETDFNRYLTELNQFNTDRDFTYGQFIDEINDQTTDFDTLVGMAELAAQYGDYSGLENLGIRIPQLSGGGGYTGSGGGNGSGSGTDSGSGTTGGNSNRPSGGGTMSASAFLGQINRIPGLTEENKVAMAVDAYNNGQLSEDEYNRVLDSLGY